MQNAVFYEAVGSTLLCEHSYLEGKNARKAGKACHILPVGDIC